MPEKRLVDLLIEHYDQLSRLIAVTAESLEEGPEIPRQAGMLSGPGTTIPSRL